ncbi:hypothetical protein [Pelomonas sp. SE-A7]|uniref:hypothetical protein n=1 Tax=Pelomonas sp. SE-A7 TaxID=3054953 RepID=UPI00259CFF41|nr:hypothetical protein [Pelomonas sp. SE-A7]MDM4766700.1 hypothetical protein [Pelomonas sp. SE-A7]
MRSRRWLELGLLVALALAGPAGAEPPQLSKVEVQGESTAPRELKTLATLYEARELFEKHHALAPQAELKFKVYARTQAEHQQRMNLALVTRQGRVPVPLDEEDNFVIDPTWNRYPDATELKSKLLDGRVTWRADIRTPGWPDHERRLGDLRLQCRVGFESGVARGGDRGFFATLAKAVFSSKDGCENSYSSSSSFADRPIFSVTLVDGPRRMTLSNVMLHGLRDVTGEQYDWGFLLRERMFRLPMGDMSWSNETRVVMEFAEDPQQPADAQLLASDHALAQAARELRVGETLAESLREKLGKADEKHFDSGRRLLRHLSVRTLLPPDLPPEVLAQLPAQDLGKLSPAQLAALLAKLPAYKAAAASAAKAASGAALGRPGLEVVELVTLFDEQDRLIKYALRRLSPTQRYR